MTTNQPTTTKRIMICGGGGQLGQKLIGAARALKNDAGEDVTRIFTYSRSQLDITKPADIRAAFEEARPDVVFNAAAYTAVDRAETEAGKARQVNIEGASRLAATCHENQTHFVHFSTDYVYDDTYNRPLREDDRTRGNGVYAQTKLEGENHVLANHPTAHIIRTSWVYAEYGHNFVRTMLRLGKERESLNIVADQIGSPTYAADLAAAAIQLADSGAPAGIYNFANSGVASWYDLAYAIFELSGMDCELRPIRTEQYPTPAERPSYSVLDTNKIASIIGPPRNWRNALAECLGKLPQ